MKLKEYLVLFVLAAIWGASFFFISLIVKEMSPMLMVFLRLLLGASGLFVFASLQRVKFQSWRPYWRAFVIIALANCVIPFLAIGWGETQVSSGMAAILNATTPLFLILISLFWLKQEPLTIWQALALIVGFIGVGVLVGPALFAPNTSPFFLLGIASCALGAASYALAGLLIRRLIATLPRLQQAFGQTFFALLLMLPLTAITIIIQPPAQFPSLNVVLALLALSLGGTSIAYILMFWLYERIGPGRTSIVTYLLPCFALIYGLLFLQEHLEWNSLVGLALVLSGTLLLNKKKARPAPQAETIEATPVPSR